MEGYRYTHGKSVMTVFSAPNYCYRLRNLGAAVQILEDGRCNYLQYEASKLEDDFSSQKSIFDFD